MSLTQHMFKKPLLTSQTVFDELKSFPKLEQSEIDYVDFAKKPN